MPTKNTELFPPPIQLADLSPAIQLFLLTLQNLSQLNEGDSSGGSYSEALPAPGLNSTTGQSAQSQELTYIKISADANTWTITGAATGTVTLTTQFQSARFKSNGTVWYKIG